MHYPHPDTGAQTPIRTDSSFTATAWVKLTASGGAAGRTVVASNGTRTSAYTLGYSGTDNRWRFTMAGSDIDNPATFSVLSNTAPTMNKWTHLAVTYSVATKRMTLYVNGIAQTATATLTGGFNAATDVTIGRRKWNGAADGWFAGQVDDVCVCAFAVAAADIGLLTMPLPPVVTFPDTTAPGIGQATTVRLSAGDDTNVTAYKYSAGSAILDRTVGNRHRELRQRRSVSGSSVAATSRSACRVAARTLRATVTATYRTTGAREGTLMALTVLASSRSTASGRFAAMLVIDPRAAS
ncbi:MAG: hypothetical protein QOH97_1468 [Actinoplanes sp.]|nr:hypothetical protein [Actinoplanes sp.]